MSIFNILLQAHISGDLSVFSKEVLLPSGIVLTHLSPAEFDVLAQTKPLPPVDIYPRIAALQARLDETTDQPRRDRLSLEVMCLQRLLESYTDQA